MQRTLIYQPANLGTLTRGVRNLTIGNTTLPNVPITDEANNTILTNYNYSLIDPNLTGDAGHRMQLYQREFAVEVPTYEGGGGAIQPNATVRTVNYIGGAERQRILRNAGIQPTDTNYNVAPYAENQYIITHPNRMPKIVEDRVTYAITDAIIPHAAPPIPVVPVIAPTAVAPAVDVGPHPVGGGLPAAHANVDGAFGGNGGPIPQIPTTPAYNPIPNQDTNTRQLRNPSLFHQVHVCHLTGEIQPVHVDPLRRELSPVHAEGKLKTNPLKRHTKRLPPLSAAEKKITLPPKEVAKVVTPPKKIQQPIKKVVKPAAPQPSVNINVAEKRGSEGEAKSTTDLEKLIKILQLLQPKTVTRAPTKIPELIKTIKEVEKPVVKETITEKPVEKESTTYIQIPDIDKTRRLIEEIKAELNKPKPEKEKEEESYTLVQLPDGRKVDRTDETLKVLEEIKAELGRVKNEPQGPTYIQLPEKREPEQFTFLPLPEVKAPTAEEKITFVQLPEAKAPAPEEKKEEITYVQLPDVKAPVQEKKEEITMIPIPEVKKTEEKKPEEKKPEEKVSETVAETNHIRAPFPNMGFAPMPMMMAAPQTPPIIVNQGMSDGESKSNFWSNFFKVLLILLLLASLLGIGYLMYKNNQVQQDSGKQKTEPEPEPKPGPKPEGNTPQQQVQEEVKVEGKPEPIAQVQTNEGETINPICSEAPAVQLNVDAERVSLGADTGNISQIAKDAIKLEQVGTHNRLVSENGSIDTSRIIINKGTIQVREWGDITKSPKVYEGTIQSNGKALINGTEYTIMDENGKAYSQGALDIASQTSYNRNDNQTLSTDFGTLKQDLQINKNNTFTLDTKTEKGAVIASNTVDDISGNTTMQNILKEKLNDSKITQGEYNRIMDALDDGKLNNSYLRAVSNTSHISLDNNHAVGNSTGV